MSKVSISLPSALEVPAQPTASRWLHVRHHLKQNRFALIAFLFLLCMGLGCLVGPLLSSYTYSQQDLHLGTTGPSWEHWMGTDLLGRDLMVRILCGGRISLGVGFAGTAVAMLIGVLYGALSGVLGGFWDSLLMRLLDVLYALPFTLFVILLMVLFGRNLLLLFFAIGAVEWMSMARVVRGQILALKKRAFVEAAQAMGQSRRNIVIRHFFPNVVGNIIVWGTLSIPHIMALEALMSFVGLGVQPPETSWGLLIRDGADTMVLHPWLLIFPCLFFTCTLLAINTLGDSLRDLLDPRMASRP